MGHQRLGEIPKTQRWNAVVSKLASGSSLADPTIVIDDIAAETLFAAEAGLGSAIDDAGLRFTFYLLTQIVLAAREQDWMGSLAEQGINLGPNRRRVLFVVYDPER